MNEKYASLEGILQGYGSAAIAFSGGVDSTFLLYAAAKVLGEQACALTMRSAAFPDAEFDEAEEFCRTHGIRQVVLHMDQLQIPGFSENTPDRCYICKKALFTGMKEEASRLGLNVLAEGSNVDDLGDYRPGLRALRELGIASPLKEAGLTKADIRQLSARAGLSTASKPSYACLATRLPYGEEITEEKLRMIGQGEQMIRAMGFSQVRVRMHGNMARIEVLPSETARMLDEEVRRQITASLHGIGFSYVSLDLDGYRTGSMNEVLH